MNFRTMAPAPKILLLVDQDVERAVHRLEVVVRALHVHGREHVLLEPAQVPGGLEQLRLGDVRAVHKLVAGLLVPAHDIIVVNAPARVPEAYRKA